MLLPLLQNNLLATAYVYAGSVQLILSTPGVYQKGSDFQYTGSIQWIVSTPGNFFFSPAYEGQVALQMVVASPTLANFAYAGSVNLVLASQAVTFISSAYAGHVALVLSVQGVPISQDRVYVGHSNLVIAVIGDVQLEYQDVGGPPPGLIAIPSPPSTGRGWRQLVAIPN